MKSIRKYNKYQILFSFLFITVFTFPQSFAQKKQSEYSLLVDDCEKGKYNKIDAVIIADSTDILLEHYFNGFSEDDLHKCYSVTKSITSLLFGVLEKKNQLPGLNDKLFNYFPEYKELFKKNPDKKKITIKHLLTMTAGFKWNEFGGIPPKLSESDDVIKAILELPMDSEPGTKFTYNSGVSVILGRLLEKFSNKRYEELLSEFFKILGVNNFKIDYLTDDVANSGAGLWMTARGLTKVGQFLLKNDNRFISSEWIKKSTKKMVERGNHSDYAMHWWRYDKDNKILKLLNNTEIYFASGHGGQFLWVLPELGKTVVVFSSNYSNGKEAHELFYDHIAKILLEDVK